MEVYDVIIVGLGVMGSSCFYHLSLKGLKVLGIEQHESPHEFGSSGGETRTVRTIYYEDKELQDLMARSTKAWEELQKKADIRVFHRMTGVAFGDGRTQNIGEHQDVVPIDNQTLQTLYGKHFNFTKETQGVLDHSGGVGFISNAIATFLKLGQEVNPQSKIISNCRFIGKEIKGPEDILVNTDLGQFRTRKLIISAGYWINTMREELKIKPHHLFTGKVCTYFFKVPTDMCILKGFPWFFSEEQGQFIFAIPYNGLLKLGFHHIGPILTNHHYHDKGSGDNYEAIFRDFFAKYLPTLKDAPVVKKSTCYYTMTSDENFIIDFHPQTRDILIMSPCSGHGFKFSIVFGELAAKMIETGRLQVKQFSLDRFRPKF